MTLIIALQILNMSIDSATVEFARQPGQVDNFNYMDTFVEYVAEVILKHDNAIPESGNRQQKDMQQHKHIQIAVQKIESSLQILPMSVCLVFPRNNEDKYAYQFVKEINPPPPKA
ncbi:hypothetical protein BH11BAC4_BH11BAC4_21800 [soil metagenome]